MKVFISWSGERSKHVAVTLRDWLPTVIQSLDPWMSAADIEAGARWGANVEKSLADSSFGIICLTKSNQTAPWIHFEAGALAKTVQDCQVCPYLVDLQTADIDQGPLTQFQAKSATKDGTRELLISINRANQKNALPDDVLEKSFERGWPEFESAIENMPNEPAPQMKRGTPEMVEEILVMTREIKRLLQDINGCVLGGLDNKAATSMFADADVLRSLSKYIDCNNIYRHWADCPESRDTFQKMLLHFDRYSGWREKIGDEPEATQTPSPPSPAG